MSATREDWAIMMQSLIMCVFLNDKRYNGTDFEIVKHDIRDGVSRWTLAHATYYMLQNLELMSTVKAQLKTDNWH
jgi:hypothetical protein